MVQVSLERGTHLAALYRCKIAVISNVPLSNLLLCTHTRTWKFWNFLVRASRLGMFSGAIFMM